MKECTGCHEVKPIEEFYRHPTASNGRASRCKACAEAKRREKRPVQERRRVKADTTYRLPDQFGEMACACWCQKSIVHVPADDIRRGITRPCERPECKEMAA